VNFDCNAGSLLSSAPRVCLRNGPVSRAGMALRSERIHRCGRVGTWACARAGRRRSFVERCQAPPSGAAGQITSHRAEYQRRSRAETQYRVAAELPPPPISSTPCRPGNLLSRQYAGRTVAAQRQGQEGPHRRAGLSSARQTGIIMLGKVRTALSGLDRVSAS
jgi:hypothetical protein